MLNSAPAIAQSFRVQCPSATNLHPAQGSLSDAAYAQLYPGQIKCQHISGGDGYATMADGHQIYLFGFGPLSGLQKIASGYAGTDVQATFNASFNPQGGSAAWNDLTHLGATAQTVGTNGLPVGVFVAPSPNDAAITDPQQMINMGALNANTPAPAMEIDEDDEFFLTLSNVGMIMRPDLFEQHTVHFHGYPNASSYFDGVPDASVAIAIAGSFTYYYTAPDAGTYFWHCHITPPEHLQMGMEGQLWVRPRQNRVPVGSSLYAFQENYNLGAAPINPRTNLPDPCLNDILCSAPLPAATTTDPNGNTYSTTSSPPVAQSGIYYAYNDGDSSTRYEVQYPLQIMGFDPNFHFVGMTFNPETFNHMKDKYYLLNGRGYPDTVSANASSDGASATPTPVSTEASDGFSRPSQPMPALIVINKSPCAANPEGSNGCQLRALLRISNLSVTEYTTIATIGAVSYTHLTLPTNREV